MATTREDIPPGTHMLNLKTRSGRAPLHGFEIADTIQTGSERVLQAEERSLYRALQRMLLRGWLEADWGRTAENRRVRYYQLTRSGRKGLKSEPGRYQRVNWAITRLLQPA